MNAPARRPPRKVFWIVSAVSWPGVTMTSTLIPSKASTSNGRLRSRHRSAGDRRPDRAIVARSGTSAASGVAAAASVERGRHLLQKRIEVERLGEDVDAVLVEQLLVGLELTNRRRADDERHPVRLRV